MIFIDTTSIHKKNNFTQYHLIMNRILNLFLLVFICSYSNATNELLIQGSFKGISDNSTVLLCQYSYDDIIIAQTIVKASRCTLDNLPPLQEGVYQIIIQRPILENNAQSNYFFNLIVDKSENEIEFVFDPTSSIIPTFTKSNCNRNWSEFLKLQSFRLAVIQKLKFTAESNNKSWSSFEASSKDIIKKEIEELKALKAKFINLNFNKWSTYMVKYDLTEFVFEEKDKGSFWSKFDTNNSDLKNTPIYQELIRYYLITFCSNCNEEEYRIAFAEVIDAFSSTAIMKEWAIKYIVTGLQKIENKTITNFIVKKYKYKT